MSLVSSPKIVLISLCVVAFFFLYSTIKAQDLHADKNLKFIFSAVAKVKKNDQPQIIPFTNDIALESGTLIKFYFEFEKEGCLYLFHEGSHGDLTLLFPHELNEVKIPKLIPFFIPEGVQWIELDYNTGKESFYLIVSSLRFEQLELLYSNHVKLKNSDEILQSTKSILNEIKSISRETLRKTAEKPLRIAGKLRGNLESAQPIPEEILYSALEIVTDRTYVKTIKIDHK